ILDPLQVALKIHCKIGILVLPVPAQGLAYVQPAGRYPAGRRARRELIALADLGLDHRHEAIAKFSTKRLKRRWFAMDKKNAAIYRPAIVEPAFQLVAVSMCRITVDPANFRTNNRVAAG